MRFFKLMSYFLERNYRGERSSNFILSAVFLSMRYIHFDCFRESLQLLWFLFYTCFSYEAARPIRWVHKSFCIFTSYFPANSRSRFSVCQYKTMDFQSIMGCSMNEAILISYWKITIVDIKKPHRFSKPVRLVIY